MKKKLKSDERTVWKSGKNLLTDNDLVEGVREGNKRDHLVTEEEVRSACFQADLFITFMVRIN